MKTPHSDNPIRNTLKHLALASTMGEAMYFGASPAKATPVTTGLALWLDASDASTMTLAGTTVNEWRDKNGSAAKMTLATGTPTVVASGIGGIPTVHFTSGSSMGDGVNHSAPVTIFYVSRQPGGTNQRVLSGGNNWLLGYWGGARGDCGSEIEDRRSSTIHDPSSKIQNSKFKIQNRLAYEPRSFPELMGFLRGSQGPPVRTGGPAL